MTIPSTRLAQISARFAELEARLASGTLEGADFVAASRDYAELEPVARAAEEVTSMRGESAAVSGLNSTVQSPGTTGSSTCMHNNRIFRRLVFIGAQKSAGLRLHEKTPLNI